MALLPGLFMGAAGALVCHWVLGTSLGLFLGGLLLCAIVVPLLVLSEDGLARPLVAAGATVVGAAIVWLWAALNPPVVPPGQPPPPWPSLDNWARCTAVLLAFAAALAGPSLLLRQLRVCRPLAAFLVSLLAVAWISWPVWLSPWLSGRGSAVAWLVPAHPTLTVNSVVRQLGLWDEQPLAYHLTVLNRDVTYQLPPENDRKERPWFREVGAALLVHLGIGLLTLLPVTLPTLLRARRSQDSNRQFADPHVQTHSPARSP